MEVGILDHIIIFLLGIVLPLFAVLQSQANIKEIKFDTQLKKQVYYSNSIFQWIWVLGVGLVWWFYGRSVDLLGFQKGNWEILSIFLLISSLLLYLFDVWWALRNKEKIEKTKQKWLRDIPILPVNSVEFKHFLVVAFTAGVCEEIIFRGFFINYFLAINEDNLMGKWLATFIPAFLFAFGHIYQGNKAVAKTMIMAMLFGWIFLLTKSILLLILLHFLVDVIGGYLAYRILKSDTN